MMRLPHLSRDIPQVPGPGAEKLRDPRHARRVWLIVAALVAVLGILSGPLGISTLLDAMRRDFVAMRYVQSAAGALAARPVDRGAVVAMVDRAVQIAPDNSIVAKQAGVLYMYAGAYPKAVARLSRIPERDLATEISLGHCLLLTGRRESGTRILQKATQQAYARRRSSAIGPVAYALYMNNIGYAYAAAGVELQRAHSLLTEAVRLDPLQPAFIDSLGWAYYQSRDPKQALFYLERAVRLAGPFNSAETYYHLGAAYSRMGRVRPAAEALLKALECDPEYQDAQAELHKLGYTLPQPSRA